GLEWWCEVDRWGRFPRGTQAARADLLASEGAQRFVITTLVSDVGSAYFQLLELDLELEISRRTLSAREGSLQLTKVREQGGVAAMMDVRQAETMSGGAPRTSPNTECQS